MEKIGLDLIEFKEEEYFMLVTINYFTRRMWDWPLRSKSAQGKVEFIKDLYRQGKKSETIVTDNGKEFQNDLLRKLYCNLDDVDSL